MSSILGALALASLCLGSPDVEELVPSYLFRNPSSAPTEGEPYHAQAGDILLFDDHSRWAALLYQAVGTGTPMHAALVFTRPDGTPGILEAGPNMVQKVFVVNIESRLHAYDGTILVRRLRAPLTPEQSKTLTDFCMAQEGKSYALGRLLLQGTPLRARGPVRGYCLGKTCLDRDRWMCSELVIAAMTAAGVLNAKDHPATTFYPRDLCYDEGRHDLSRFYEPPALWYPRPELEYVGSAIKMQPPR